MPWDPRELLALPGAYRGFAGLVGARRSRSELVRRYVRPRQGDRVLDCGCGPGEFVDHLPGVEYVGVDVDPRYVADARRRLGDRATFRLGPVGPETVPEIGRYDLVLAMGLLHHLDDDAVRAFLALARQALTPSGRLVTVDPCYTPDQSPLARALVRLDRGAHVRERDEWPALIESAFRRSSIYVRHDLLRIPYTHIITECLAGDS